MVGETPYNANIRGNCVARALYDNTAESPDELVFRKGDLLTVLEQNTAGLEGWWLCSLRGRQGICPGNRLRIVPGCYDTGTGVPGGGPLSRSSSGPVQQTPTARTPSNKVVTPKRIGDLYTYDTPRRYPAPHSPVPLPPHPTLDYDVPPSRHHPHPVHGGDGSRLSRSSSLRYESPRHIPRASLEHHDMPLSPHDPNIMANMMHYDIPRSQQNTAQSNLYDSPRPQMAHGVSPLFAQEPSIVNMASKSLIKGVRGGHPCLTSAISRPVETDAGQYDVPKPIHEQHRTHAPASSDRSSGVSIMSCDSTSSSASSLPASESPYLSSIGGSSNRSSLEVQDVYDVPPEPRRVGSIQKPRLPPRENQNQSSGLPFKQSASRSGPARGEGIYDVPPQVSRDARSSDVVDMVSQRISSGSDCSYEDSVDGTGLPLEYDSATDMLAKLQQDVQCSLEKLANFTDVTSPSNKSVTNERFEESKIIIDRLKSSLQEFVKFSDGSTVNASKHGNEKLARTLRKQIEPLTSTYNIINNTWTCSQTNKDQAIEIIHQLTNITKPLIDDVRQLSILIQTNANQLFKRSPNIEKTKQKSLDDDEKTPVQERPTHDRSVQKTSEIENLYVNETAFLEDYDYVKLESRESAEREHQQIKESLPCNLRKSYDNLVKQSHFLVDNDHEKALCTTNATPTNTTNTLTKNNYTARLDANDKQVLAFYANQADLHIQHLNTAIDAFFLTIEENQPPKVFIAHSKFVILSAHKLVFIGDTVHRNVVNNEVRTLVLNCSNALCDAMKNTVAAAKTAAIQFPSVSAVQAMVDSCATISHLALNLRNAVCQA